MIDPMSHWWTILQEASSKLYTETGDERLLGLQDVAMAICFDDPGRLVRGLVNIAETRTGNVSVAVSVTIFAPTAEARTS